MIVSNMRSSYNGDSFLALFLLRISPHPNMSNESRRAERIPRFFEVIKIDEERRAANADACKRLYMRYCNKPSDLFKHM